MSQPLDRKPIITNDRIWRRCAALNLSHDFISREGRAWIAAGRKRRLQHEGRWLMPNGMILAMVALGLTMLTPSDVAAHGAFTASLQDEPRGDGSGIDRRIIERELGLFRSAQISLRRAMEIAEALHSSSRTMDISLDGGTDASVFRVRTAKDSLIWENTIDAQSGTVRGDEITSAVQDLHANDRVDLAAFRSIRQSMSDAVFIAEVSTSGRAIGGSLTHKNGRLNFVIIVLSGDDLKRVVLEPPRPNRWKPVSHRLRQRELRKTHRTRNRARADMFEHADGCFLPALPRARCAVCLRTTSSV